MSLTSWSYSKLKCFETCPAQFAFKYLEHVPEPSSEAMSRGTVIHAHLEDYVEGRSNRMPRDVHNALGPALRKEMALFRKQKTAEAEVEMAVDKRWRRVDWRDRDAWLRAKIDVRCPELHPTTGKPGVRIIDHKTGRERPAEHGEQLSLYSTIEYSTNAEAAYVVAEIFYVDHGTKLSALYDNRRVVLGKIRDSWNRRARRLLTARAFKPSPSRHACRWCPFGISKGGPCRAEAA